MFIDETGMYVVARNNEMGELWFLDTYNFVDEIIDTAFGNIVIVHRGNGEYYSIFCVDFNPYIFTIAIYQFSNPKSVKAYVTINAENNQWYYWGDVSIWNDIPLTYMTLWGSPDVHGYYAILLIEPEDQSIKVIPMDWYESSDEYDHERMLPGSIIMLPATECALISMQNTAHAMLYDLRSRRALTKIVLGGVGGGREFRIGEQKRSLWTANRTVVTRLNLESLNIEEAFDLSTIFHAYPVHIGEFALDMSLDKMAVSVPAENKVVILDSMNFNIIDVIDADLTPDEIAIYDGNIK